MTTAHPSAYLEQIRTTTDLDNWSDRQLLDMGHELCRAGVNESSFFDAIGVLTADRDPAEQAAHDHLC